MNSLLDINNAMNTFSLSFHNGKRELYDNLLALGANYPELIAHIKDYPLVTLAIERGEENAYAHFAAKLDNLHISRDEVKNSSRTM